MRDPRTSRAERLLDLLSFFLDRSRPVPWAEIRDAFPAYREGNEASCLRKFERDKAELVELGLPIEWVPPEGDELGGYRLAREAYYLPDLDLTAEERTLLSVAGAAALEHPAFPLRAELVRALDKLFFSSAPRLRLGSEPLLAAEAAHLERLGRAAAEHRDVLLRYRSFDGVRTERRFSPYGLAFRSGAWLAVGRCHLRDAIRTFAVERVEAVELLPETFEVPADFDLRDHVGLRAWELGRHAPYEAAIEVAPAGLPLAAGLFERVEAAPTEGGGRRYVLRVTNEEAVVRLVLRLSPHARVVAPDALVDQVEATARRIAERHEGEASRPVVAGETAAAAEHSARRPPDLRERLHRALLLIPRAVAKSGCTVAELAEEMRLSEEALLAEIDFLRMVGKPPFSPADLVDIDVVDGRVYAALPQGFSRPPALTPLEAVALEAAASAAIDEEDEALAHVRDRLRCAIPPAFRERFDRLAGRIRMETLGLEPETARLLDRAIAERRELSFSYFGAARGEATERRVRPLKRLLYQGYWYLYAYCCTRRDRRLFRLDRAAALRLEETRFIPRPLDEVPLDLGRGHMASVRVDPGPFAQPGHLWRLGAREVGPLPDGGALARFPMVGEAYLVSTVLSLAGAAELLDPPSLRARVRDAARSLASD